MPNDYHLELREEIDPNLGVNIPREYFVIDSPSIKDLAIKCENDDSELRKTWDGVAAILKRSLNLLRDGSGTLYYYSGGIYHPDENESIINSILYNYCIHYKCPKYLEPSKRRCILDYLINLTDFIPLKPRQDIIVFKNYSYDLIKMGSIDHSPSHKALIQIPVNYDYSVRSGEWDQFIFQVSNIDTMENIYRMIALLLVPFTKNQKAFFLLGNGSNGKGLFCDGLTSFLGVKNVGSLKMEQLENKFMLSSLFGKLANISTEESTGRLEETSIFKTLSAGEPITFDRKYKNPMTAELFCRLILATNNLPQTNDTSQGFFRRFSIFPFSQHFENNPSEYNRIKRALVDPIEQTALLNNVLPLVRDVCEVGIQPTESMTKVLNTYVEREAPDLVFLKHRMKESSHSTLTKAEVFQRYCDFCEEVDSRPIAREAFWRKLRSLYTKIRVSKQMQDGSQVYIVTGLGWR